MDLDLSRAILIWAFDDAPAPLRALLPTDAPGFVQWLAIVPAGCGPAWWMTGGATFAVNDLVEARLDDGRLLCVGRHG